MNIFPDKRKNRNNEVENLLKSRKVNNLHKTEKRKDVLEKINNIKENDRTYYYTLFSCIAIILLLSFLALFGGYTK
jgi:hypothetical protein